MLTIEELGKLFYSRDCDERLTALNASLDIAKPDNIALIVEWLAACANDDSSDLILYPSRIAIEQLIKLGAPAMTILIRALNSSDLDTTENALRAIERIASPRAKPLLLGALNTTDGPCRVRLAVVLGNLREAAVLPDLVRALNRGSGYLLSAVVRSLGAIGTREAFVAILNAMSDNPSSFDYEGEQVSHAGIDVLADQWQASLPVILHWLSHDRARKCKDGPRYALRRIFEQQRVTLASPEFIPLLLLALEVVNYSEIRPLIVELLQIVGIPTSVPVLIQLLLTEHGESSFPNGMTATHAHLMLIDRLSSTDGPLDDRDWNAGDMISNGIVPVLLLGLRNENDSIRGQSAGLLRRFRPCVSYYPEIANALDEQVSSIGETLVELMTLLDPKPTSALVSALGTDRPLLRKRAVEALARISPPDAVHLLIGLLETDDDTMVRSAAASALGEIGTPDAVPALITSLTNTERDIRKNACAALGRLNAKSAVRELCNRLEHDDESSVRLEAAVAIARIGSARGISSLTKALNDSDIIVRTIAAEAVAKFPTIKGIVALRDAIVANSDDDFRDERFEELALEAMCLAGSALAPRLVNRLGHNDEDIRCEALIALEAIGETAVPVLTKAVRGKNINRCARDLIYELLSGIQAPAEMVAPALVQELIAWESSQSSRPDKDIARTVKGLERMGTETTDMIRQLRTFFYFGLILDAREVNSLRESLIVKEMYVKHGHICSGRNIRNHLDDLEVYFGRYYEKFHAGEPFEFFDRVSGRPIEILKDGWDMWHETKQYFEMLGFKPSTANDEKD